MLICNPNQINEKILEKLQLIINNKTISLEKEQSLLSLGITEDFDCIIKLKKI